MYTPHVPAEGLHPFEGLSTVIAYEVFALGVYSLVSVQRAGGDEGFPTDVTSVGSLPRVRPDVRRQVRAVAEALLAHRAAVGPVFVFLAVVLVGVKGQHMTTDYAAAFQIGGDEGGRDEILDVRVQPVQLLPLLLVLLLAVAHPEVSVRLLLLLLLLDLLRGGLRVLRVLGPLLHAAAAAAALISLL